jgi:hypothetical protein
VSFKIAAIITQYFPLSHADVIVTRWLEPNPNDALEGFKPSTQIASMYVMQHPLGDPPPEDWFTVSPVTRQGLFSPKFDISKPVAAHYGVPIFDSIREALTLGGDALAVDAVLVIGEHGDFPQNEFDQKLYPRKELFDAVVQVFRESGQVVPIFLDKHLSWNMDWAREIILTVRDLEIPFYAGSSLPMPVTQPLKPLELPMDAEISESLALFYLHPEIYGIHSIENLQAILERRRGGESGIAAITAYRGEGVWTAMDAGAWSRELFEAALSSTVHPRPGDYRQNCRRHGAHEPVAFVIEHLDGHTSAQVMLEGHISNFSASIRRPDGTIWASPVNAFGTNVSGYDDFVPHFARLDREIERFFLTRRSPVALERHLLTTLEVATWMHALKRPGERLETPELHLAYRST